MLLERKRVMLLLFFCSLSEYFFCYVKLQSGKGDFLDETVLDAGNSRNWLLQSGNRFELKSLEYDVALVVAV